MPEFIVEPTATAQWQRLVRDAAAATPLQLDEQLESYLVLLLSRCTRDADAITRVMAIEYLEGMLAGGAQRSAKLRDVGDHCLLIAGLFPHRAERRRVRISYFVDLGRSAYQQLGEALNQSAACLYRELSQTFVSLMDVLHAMRELGGTPSLTPLQAIELWEDTGSPHALKSLGRHSQAQPLSDVGRRRH